MLNTQQIKKDFPIFSRYPRLVYLDSSATTLKPKAVIETVSEYYKYYSANIFRGIYPLSEKATAEFEKTRARVAQFINASSADEIIFTRNTTESLNLIAYGLGRKIVGQDDEIITTVMEHHSNFVPWQQLAGENGAKLKIIDINRLGFLDLQIEPLEKSKNQLFSGLELIITKKTKIFAITFVSNVLGVVNPIKTITCLIKKINPRVIIVVDAAQAIAHQPINVQDLGCDLLTFSSHKMLGPTGVGCLWGKLPVLKEMLPFMFGGEMIKEVYLNRTVFKEPPYKFEAGTPAIGEVIGLKAAIDYIEKIGWQAIEHHEKKLTEQLYTRLISEFGRQSMKILGPELPHFAKYKKGIIAFHWQNYHPHDIGSILADEDICVRAGNHCAMPLHQRLGINASTRVSFYIYNTTEDIDPLLAGLHRVKKLLGK